MRKTRSDNVLMQLPASQRGQLDGWLLLHSYRKVQELIALPAPEGLGRKVSLSAISSYYQKVIPRHLEAVRDERTIAAVCASAVNTNRADFHVATVDALKQRLFRLSINQHCDTNELARMFRLVEKARELHLSTSNESCVGAFCT